MYNYTSKNLLENPEKYFYSSFIGKEFIESYIKTRTVFLKNLKCENIDLITWLKELNLSNNPDKIFTGYILFNYLKSNKKNDFINILFKKFEVSKKIHCTYDLKTLRPIGNNINILNYILFGLVLIKLYEESRFIGYLNSLLKISDIIISQDINEILKYSIALNIIIKKELDLVRNL